MKIPVITLKEITIFGKRSEKEIPIQPIQGGVITSEYGERTLGSQRSFHPGLDIGIYGEHKNVPVRAAYSGKVAWIDRTASGSFGNVVYVQLSDGWYAIYPHMRSVRSDLKIGQVIPQGYEVGLMGNTGYVWARDDSGAWAIRHNPDNNDGIHLHFEIRKGLGPGNSRNPIEVRQLYK